MTKFVFDLDGTITKVETLPLLAAELGLSDEMKLLTDLTLSGQIPFDKSFKLRYLILRNVPLKKIQAVMSTVELDGRIVDFIAAHKKNCTVVTGNLDCWIEPLAARLDCEIFSSTSELDGNLPVLTKILDKGAVIRQLKRTGDKIVAVGESFNDVPMFNAADVAIAYGGVHKPVDAALAVADYVIFDGGELCRLLEKLNSREV